MNEMNERFIVKFVVESEGYKVWDTAWRVFASGSYTLQSDAQAVADRKNANPATPAPAPVDILAAKNERIAALEDEHDHQLRRALRAESELADYKRRFEMENERANGQAGLITRMKAALEQIFEPDAVEIWLKHGQALQAPAPTEAPATDEPEGYMRPCYRCCGTGTVKADRLTSYLIPCPICDGTGIHEDEE
jgi:hypothetical protein